MSISILICIYASVRPTQYFPIENLGYIFRSKIKVPYFSTKVSSNREETLLSMKKMVIGNDSDIRSKHNAKTDAKISPDRLNFIYCKSVNVIRILTMYRLITIERNNFGYCWMISLNVVFQKKAFPILLDTYENHLSIRETAFRIRVIMIPVIRINIMTKVRLIFLMQFIDLKPNSLKYWLRGTSDVTSNSKTFEIIESGCRKPSWDACIVYWVINLVIPGILTEIKESMESWDNAWSIPNISGIAPDLHTALG